MPKTLILLLGDDPRLAERARRVAAAARTVRFAEVDVRAASSPAGALGAADYDAVVLGVGADADGAAARAALRAFDPHGALGDRVGAAFAAGGAADAADGPACWAALRALAAHGLVLVPPAEEPAALVTASGAAAPDARAAADEADRRLGRRVATVAGWVRHARGHDHADAHGHGHAHTHGHAHPHAH
jgi:hypothetical protein